MNAYAENDLESIPSFNLKRGFGLLFYASMLGLLIYMGLITRVLDIQSDIKRSNGVARASVFAPSNAYLIKNRKLVKFIADIALSTFFFHMASVLFLLLYVFEKVPLKLTAIERFLLNNIRSTMPFTSVLGA